MSTQAVIQTEAPEKTKLDQIYSERNACAIAAAKFAVAAGLNAGRGFDPRSDAAFDGGWGHVVYIDLPGGKQVSYHIHPDQVHLLEGLPEYVKKWDGTYLGRDPEWAGFCVPTLSIDGMIDAAAAQAALYNGDDRKDIKTDVLNAFFAGVKFAEGGKRG